MEDKRLNEEAKYLQQHIFAEQISLLFKQYTLPAATASLVATIIVAALWNHVPHKILIGWYLLQNVCLLAGHILVWRNKSADFTSWSRESWLHVHMAVLSLIGLLWGGMTIFLFFDLPLLSQILVLMVSLGAAASALVLAIPVLTAYYTFLTLSLMPPLLWLLGQYPSG